MLRGAKGSMYNWLYCKTILAAILIARQSGQAITQRCLHCTIGYDEGIRVRVFIITHARDPDHGLAV